MVSDDSNPHRPDLIQGREWRQIVNSAIDTAVISTDPEGRVTSWSRGAEAILGWKEEEMLGQTLDRVFGTQGQAQGQFAREMADAKAKGRGGGGRRMARAKRRLAFLGRG